jgi:hypothetical protein
MTTDRDPQVTALLDTIEPVPARPGFWEDLEARLWSEASPALELAPGAGADGARRVDGLRRRRVVAGIAAAAAVIAVALGGLALRDDRDATKTVPGHPDPAPGVTEPGESRVTYAPDSPQGQAVAYLDQWIRSLVEGDTTQGWDLLGPQSQDSLGSQAAYAASSESFRSTWGPYANLDARDAHAAQLGDTGAWVVVLGHHTGDPQPLTVVVRVVVQDESLGRVEPFLPGPALDLIQMTGLPQEEGALGPGDRVPLALTPNADVAVLLDGDPVPDGSLDRAGDGAVTGFRLPDSVTDGTHVVAVGQQLGDGTLAADLRSFRVVAPGG